MTTRKRARELDMDMAEVIARLVRDGHGAASIFPLLQENPDFESRVPHRRTLQRIVKDMRDNSSNLPELDRLLDEPFEWHKLDQYGLPWESSGYLLEMWRVARESPDLKNRIYPTARDVRWWWRVHLADIDLGIPDVWALAHAFTGRELVQLLLDIPDDMTDIEALLAYRPWKDELAIQAWVQAVNENRIPKLKFLNEELVDRLLDSDASVQSLWTIFMGFSHRHFAPHRGWKEVDHEPKYATEVEGLLATEVLRASRRDRRA